MQVPNQLAGSIMLKILGSVTLLLMTVLTGCGQTGPLYLPKPPKPVQRTTYQSSNTQPMKSAVQETPKS